MAMFGNAHIVIYSPPAAPATAETRTTLFRALRSFEGCRSAYIEGQTYKVRPRDAELAALVIEWGKAGLVQVIGWDRE